MGDSLFGLQKSGSNHLQDGGVGRERWKREAGWGDGERRETEEEVY